MRLTICCRKTALTKFQSLECLLGIIKQWAKYKAFFIEITRSQLPQPRPTDLKLLVHSTQSVAHTTPSPSPSPPETRQVQQNSHNHHTISTDSSEIDHPTDKTEDKKLDFDRLEVIKRKREDGIAADTQDFLNQQIRPRTSRSYGYEWHVLLTSAITISRQSEQ
ncbi:hypothetical protein AB4K20DRAFT_1867271 [Rhizopus microsporus]